MTLTTTTNRSPPPQIDQLGAKVSPKIPRLIPRAKNPSSAPSNPLPVPETSPLPPPPATSTLKFVIPTRRILSSDDHDLFLASPTYSLIRSFVFSLSEAAAGKKISSLSSPPPPPPQSPIISTILSILSSIEDIITLYPPADQGGSRFGNPSFRLFLDAVSRESQTWHENLGIPSSPAIGEVSTYLHNSFGSRARIDYGSGHELNFIIWLLCLNRLSLLSEPTFPAVTLLIFPQYLQLLRKIQSTYYLEPAGSHGVWGLDDYHFLPFLFGASQLLHHPYIRPLSIHNELILEEEGDEYLYLDMVRWTMTSKTVKGLKWTQPMLDDISGAKSWEKVEQGMRRMFIKEVLGKLPVMQHFLFGSLVPAAEGMSSEQESELVIGHQDHGKEEEEKSSEGPIPASDPNADAAAHHAHAHSHGHVHRDDTWGDCCGIKIPSTVAAAQEALKHGEGKSLRRVPFD